MKKILALLLAAVMCLSFAACGESKSEYVIKLENLINEIGEVTIESETKIMEAEQLYSFLSDDDKKQVSNYSVLQSAREEFDSLTPVVNKDNVIGTWYFTTGWINSSLMERIEIYKGGTAKGCEKGKDISEHWYEYTWEIVDDVLQLKGQDFAGFSGAVHSFTLEMNGDTAELHSTDGQIILTNDN